MKAAEKTSEEAKKELVTSKLVAKAKANPAKPAAKKVMSPTMKRVQESEIKAKEQALAHQKAAEEAAQQEKAEKEAAAQEAAIQAEAEERVAAQDKTSKVIGGISMAQGESQQDKSLDQAQKLYEQAIQDGIDPNDLEAIQNYIAKKQK